MVIELNDIFLREQSVFKKFNKAVRLSENCTGFVSPQSEEVPHWNMIYPDQIGHVYSKREIGLAQEFYKQYNVNGHVLLAGDEWKSKSVETSEYFYINEGACSKTNHVAEVKCHFSIISTQDLDLFSFVVQKSFQFNDQTAAYFKEKMVLLSRQEGSKFWVVSYDGAPCGSASTFKTDVGSDFMFNVAVLPEFQKKGIGAHMLKFLVGETNKPLYIYSHNQKMRTRVLPGAGFMSAGVVYVVTLSDYLKGPEG